MSSLSRVLSALAVALTAVLSTTAAGAAAVPDDERSVRELATAQDLSFGVMSPADALADPGYADLVAANATTISTSNELSFAVVQPEQGTFDFGPAEALVDFAVEHGLTVRGHDLIAPGELPVWVTDGAWDAASLTEVIIDHVTTVVSHFAERNPGVITDWDVVRRAGLAAGAQRPSVLQAVLGDAWVDAAFDAARAADPAAQLFYDDFFDDVAMAHEAARSGQPIVQGADAAHTTCDAVPRCGGVASLVGGLVAREVPIDGVGFEAHLFSAEPVDFTQFSRWVSDLELEWAITEFDVPLPATEVATAEMLTFQADTYRAALAACVDAADCDTFVSWGLSDRYSPVPDETGGVYGGALWFADDGTPKPAHDAIRDVLAANAPPAPPTTAPPTTDPPVSPEASSSLADDDVAASSEDDSGSVLVPAAIGAAALVAVAALVVALVRLRRRRTPASPPIS